MKNIKLLGILGIAALFVGCQQDAITDAMGGDSTLGVGTTISAAVNTSITKVNFNEDPDTEAITLTWSSADAFSVYDSTGALVADFEYHGEDGAISGQFTSQEVLAAGSYTAVYPATDAANLSERDENLVGITSQEADDAYDHLNNAVAMRAEFTIAADELPSVAFEHELAIMSVEYQLPTAIAPSTVELTDGEDVYTTHYTGVVNESNSYTTHFMIMPNASAEPRELIFDVIAADDSAYRFTAVMAKAFEAGYRYTAPIGNLGAAYGVVAITTAEELAGLAADANAVLMNDLDLSAYDNWTPIANFTGSFDGNGYTISNLTINNTKKSVGLFGTTTGATIRNVKLAEVNITSSGTQTAALAGTINGTTVSNCSVVSGTLSLTGNQSAGLIGVAQKESVVKYCSNYATVAGASRVAGIIASASDVDIISCYNAGALSNTGVRMGGILGQELGKNITIDSCYNTGELTANGTDVGGIVGFLTNSDNIVIKNCYNTGRIVSNGQINIGGILGSAPVPDPKKVDNPNVLIENCYNTGDLGGVSATADTEGKYTVTPISGNYVGGIAAKVSSTKIIGSYNTGRVSAQYFIAGIVAHTVGVDNEIAGCYNTGVIFAAAGAEPTGGIVALSEGGVIDGCYSAADVRKHGGVTSFIAPILGKDVNAAVDAETGICSGAGTTVLNCFFSRASNNNTNTHGVGYPSTYVDGKSEADYYGAKYINIETKVYTDKEIKALNISAATYGYTYTLGTDASCIPTLMGEVAVPSAFDIMDYITE